MFAHIDVERGSRLTELAERWSVTPQAMSDVVEDLVRRGYAERRPDPHDGRTKWIFLTARGTGSINESRVVVASVETWLLDLLGEADLEQLRRELRVIIAEPF